MYKVKVEFQGKWYAVKRHVFKDVFKLLDRDIVIAFAKSSAITNVRVTDEN